METLPACWPMIDRILDRMVDEIRHRKEVEAKAEAQVWSQYFRDAMHRMQNYL